MYVWEHVWTIEGTHFFLKLSTILTMNNPPIASNNTPTRTAETIIALSGNTPLLSCCITNTVAVG